jgi:hypothetical protein
MGFAGKGGGLQVGKEVGGGLQIREKEWDEITVMGSDVGL